MAEKKKEATYDDLLALPEHVVGEILEGELVVSPRPAPRHASAASGLGGQLWGPFNRPPGGSGGPGGWWILDEPELHFRKNVAVPDLAGWRRERLPSMPRAAAFELPPDWVCEVLSDSTARYDRTKKRRIYARMNVAHYWMIEPIERTLEAFRLEGERWVLAAAHAGDERVRVEPFAEIELDLGRLFEGTGELEK